MVFPKPQETSVEKTARVIRLAEQDAELRAERRAFLEENTGLPVTEWFNDNE